MTTTTTTTPATTIPDPERKEAQGTTTTRTKAAKGSRSYSITLDGAAGAQLRLVAQRKADGSAVSYVVQVTKAAGGKKTSTRGMTSKHASLEAARAAVEKMATEATSPKLGWTRKERKTGFTPKPDAFTALPPARKK
jgi:hypothetical protein